MGLLRLIEHDGLWAARFADEAVRLSQVAAPHLIAIEHVGSTAVPGLLGKPVLDIAVAVANEHAANACIAPLELLGYAYRGPHGDDPDRRYYVKDVDGRRAVQLHLYILPAPAWVEKLMFRDALRSDPQLVRDYRAEKLRVAAATQWDKAVYSVEKGPFIQKVLRELHAR